MKLEGLRCEQARRELSARLDGRSSPSLRSALDEHLATCTACSEYQESLVRLRRRLRLQPAQPVPDLAPSVVERLRRDHDGASRWQTYLRTAGIAAVITALVVGGATFRRGRDADDIASASEIIKSIRAAARHLTSYHATFDVRGTDRSIARERISRVAVWYRSPEMLRVEIRDRTTYEDPRALRDHATFISNPHQTYVHQAIGCAPGTAATCSSPTRNVDRLTIRRQPLDASLSSVTDIVLPLETMAGQEAVNVVGFGREILGRPTVHVSVPYWQAHTLVAAVQPRSSDTTDPTAEVDIWLDSRNWFPLRFAVTPPGRARPTLDVVATRLETQDVSVKRFAVPASAREVVDARFRSGTTRAFEPAYRADLEPYRSGRTRGGPAVSTYTKGLAWLTVSTARKERPPESLVSAEAVDLPRAGPAFYEPAGYRHARIVEIYDGRHHVRLESNLPRDDLFDIADSVPVTGIGVDRVAQGDEVIERVAHTEAMDLAFFKGPLDLPPGYRPVNATVTKRDDRITGAAVRFGDPESEYSGGGIVVTAARHDQLAASSERYTVYRVGGHSVRWSALRGEAEWVDGKTYRSVRVADFSAGVALKIARSMR